jgi:hypothetical protein
MLICMAQDALTTLTAQSSYPGTKYTGGVTGVVDSAFTSSLAGLQTILTGSFGTYGLTSFRTDGVLDYKTLAPLIAAALFLFCSTSNQAVGRSTNGVDPAVSDMATLAINKMLTSAFQASPLATVASGMTPSMTLKNQIGTVQYNITATAGAGLMQMPFVPDGSLDWSTWSVIVAYAG